MACTLRKYDRSDPLPPNAARTRIQKLQDLICGGPWGNLDDVCLIYWKPDNAGPGGQWVYWEDNPPPRNDPLPPAGVTIAP